MGFLTLNAKPAEPRQDFGSRPHGVTSESMAYRKNAGKKTCETRRGKRMIGRLVKLVLVLAIIGGVGLVAFAYFGDLAPPQSPQSMSVTLDAN
jgi:hypothetical protein